MKNIKALFKNKFALRIILGILIIFLFAGGWIFYNILEGRVFIDNSLIDTPIVTINSPVAGVLNQMSAVEGKYVHKGDIVALVSGEPVVSSTDGLIISADNQIGSTVNTQTQLVQIIMPSQMRVAGTIDENKGLNFLRVGQVVSFTIDAYPGKLFWGFLDEISPSAKQTQLAFSISSERPTQQFVVYAKFNTSHYPDIKNGMSAKMTVYTYSY